MSKRTPCLSRYLNHKLQVALGEAPEGEGQESADILLDFIAAAIAETVEEVVGRIEHHAPKRWWSPDEVYTTHNARTVVHRKPVQKLEEGTAPHALMFKALKTKNKNYRAAVSHSKKASLKKIMASGKECTGRCRKHRAQVHGIPPGSWEIPS